MRVCCVIGEGTWAGEGDGERKVRVMGLGRHPLGYILMTISGFGAGCACYCDNCLAK